ncbi:phage tail protein [Paenibacillus koleovorans]|uniref:phage tail protein n=1 Tax=Paenibacillus koleovorans TaxID=121608 RepID=UPI000FDB748C|nr:tail fiber protein [Paenibacillus koleovorans]
MDPYIGEIRVFAGDYAPAGWALCNGDILPIQTNQALFTIIGNAYGGDGRTNFALPNLMGQAAMHQGTGPGLTPRPFAVSGGTTGVTVLIDQMANHDHALNSQTTANSESAVNTIWANAPGGKFSKMVYSHTAETQMNPLIVNAVGGNQSHNNMQPYIAMNFIIALEGVYPVKP